MALVIDDTPNPLFFAFTEPAGTGPNPKIFIGTISYTHDTAPPAAFRSADLTLTRNNAGNLDRFGNNPVFITNDPIFGLAFSDVTDTSGKLTVTLNAPFEFYNRLGRGETLVVLYDLDIFLTSGGSDTTQVKITFHGRNDLPTAVDDTAIVNDAFLHIEDSTVLSDDLDADIHDVFAIAKAVKSGPLTLGAGTVLPAEFVNTSVAKLDYAGDTLIYDINRYYQFLTAGESVTFKIKYTMSDGHGGTDSAFYFVTLNGTATDLFFGTDRSENMLGENDPDTFFGRLGNDSIIARNGNDTLRGEEGNDILNGGRGADTLAGGAGADTFDFNNKLDSRTTAATRDVIFDFSAAEDTIDLSTIDAKSGVAGNNAFKFIGDEGFHSVKGVALPETGSIRSLGSRRHRRQWCRRLFDPGRSAPVDRRRPVRSLVP